LHCNIRIIGGTVIKKFIQLDSNQEVIPLWSFLEDLESATTFDPKKSAAHEGQDLLWDYKKTSAENTRQDQYLLDLMIEDVQLLQKQIWVGMQMPKRFISESLWKSYQLAFEFSLHRPSWDLVPIFIPYPRKKIRTYAYHFLKIKQLVIDSFKRGGKPILSSNQTNASLKNFGIGVLISVSLIALPYLNSDADFLGEPPKVEENKREKLRKSEKSLLDILNQMEIGHESLPINLDGEQFGIKIKVWGMARKLEDLFPNKITFDQAWRRLKRSGKIKYEDSSLGP
jgi:hypothetical protein